MGRGSALVARLKSGITGTLQRQILPKTQTEWNLDKRVLLQEAVKAFAKVPLDEKTCMILLTKLVFELQNNKNYTDDEITSLFFAAMKLFQSQDGKLRHRVYQALAALAAQAPPGCNFMLTQTLIRDISGRNPHNRAHALLVLTVTLDETIAEQISSHVRAALLEKCPLVSSAASKCAAKLVQIAPQVVAPWASILPDLLNNAAPFARFHVFKVLYALSVRDRNSLERLLVNYSNLSKPSAPGDALAIRYTVRLALLTGSLRSQESILKKGLTSKIASTVLETIKGLVFAAKRNPQILGLAPAIKGAISSLNVLLRHSNPIYRFAAVKQLNELTTIRGIKIDECAKPLLSLVNTKNVSILQMVLSVLVHVLEDDQVLELIEILMKTTSDLNSQEKWITLDALAIVAKKFPSTSSRVLQMLSAELKVNTGAAAKSALVNTMISISKKVSRIQPEVIEQLCEFSEDCEQNGLCVMITEFLGTVLPSLPQAKTHIKVIANRLLLEGASVRETASEALIAVAKQDMNLKLDVIDILRSRAEDSDDEVWTTAKKGVAELSSSNNKPLLFGVSIEDDDKNLPVPLDQLILNLDQSIINDTPLEITETKPVGIVEEILPRDDGINWMSPFGEVHRCLLWESPWTHDTDPDDEVTVEQRLRVFHEHAFVEIRIRNTVPNTAVDNIEITFTKPTDIKHRFALCERLNDISEGVITVAVMGSVSLVMKSKPLIGIIPGCSELEEIIMPRIHIPEMQVKYCTIDLFDNTQTKSVANIAPMRVSLSLFGEPLEGGPDACGKLWTAVSVENEYHRKYKFPAEATAASIQASFMELLPATFCPPQTVNSCTRFLGGALWFKRASAALMLVIYESSGHQIADLHVRCEQPELCKILDCIFPKFVMG